MSSGNFATEIIPESRLRRYLAQAGLAAFLGGLALILQLPAEISWRIALSLLWSWQCLRELENLSASAHRIASLSLRADGNVSGTSLEGQWLPLRLLPGSLVLSGFAWLRLGFDDGLVYGELLMKEGQDPEQWRRLQLIWQQNRAAFELSC